jgi:hypothetical protein
MTKISTGQDATLETYRQIVVALFGKESKAVQFLDKTIEESPNREKEEVVADEGQMLCLLASLEGDK